MNGLSWDVLAHRRRGPRRTRLAKGSPSVVHPSPRRHHAGPRPRPPGPQHPADPLGAGSICAGRGVICSQFELCLKQSFEGGTELSVIFEKRLRDIRGTERTTPGQEVQGRPGAEKGTSRHLQSPGSRRAPCLLSASRARATGSAQGQGHELTEVTERSELGAGGRLPAPHARRPAQGCARTLWLWQTPFHLPSFR